MLRRYQECDGGSKHERMSALLRISSPDSTSDETGDAFAGTRRGAHETRDTFAGGKRPEIGSFVRAEVSAVSNVCDKELAVVSVVSLSGSDSPALVPSVSGEAVGGCCESAPRKVARNSIGRSFNKVGKRCNSNDHISEFERDVGELRAKLRVGSAMMWILINTTGPTGVEGAGGPGCGARGRWRGLAGLRDDAPSEARGADGERAGRRPRAHQAARTDEKCPRKRHRSQLYSNMPKSHMRNMRAS